MGLIDEREREAAIQNLLSFTTRPGRRWYAVLMIVAGLSGPVLLLVGAFIGSLWMMLAGAALLVPPAAWAGVIYGQYQGAFDVATVAVDQLTAYATIGQDESSSTMLKALKSGHPMRGTR